MKAFFVILFVLISVVGVYLLWPSPQFPNPPAGVYVSSEPADTESIYRRAYYSNLSREEIINYYKGQFLPIKYFPQVRINHPPEEAYSMIRDQTRSSWLEQLVHPWRESLYVNGFYPTKPTEQIYINGTHYVNKITVHYFPSSPAARITVLMLALLSGYFLYNEYRHV